MKVRSRPTLPTVTTQQVGHLSSGAALLVSGLIILLAVFWLGIATHSFLVHVAFPFRIWLTSVGLLVLAGVQPLVAQRSIASRMVLVGAGLSLVLDFHVVHLTRILALTTVTTPAPAM